MNTQLFITNIIDKSIFDNKYFEYNGRKLATKRLSYLLDDILEEYISNDRSNYIRHSTDLKSIYGTYYKYYLDYFTELGIIKKIVNYIRGVRCNVYEICDKVKDSVYEIKVKSDKKLERRQENKQDYNPSYIDGEIRRKLSRSIYNIDIDYDGSIAWIEKNKDILTKNQITYLKSSINRIKDGDIYGYFTTDNRFYSNFTNLKKEIRCNFLTINGNKIAIIDIRNSQPFFLHIYMKYNNVIDEKYTADVLSGKIYDKLGSKLDICRNETKTEIFKVIFGKGGKWKSGIKVFDELYHDTYNFIKNKKISNRSYKTFSDILKTMESRFMFSYFIPRVIDRLGEFVFTTVHDSIMIEEQYFDEVSTIFKQCLANVVDRPEIISYNL